MSNVEMIENVMTETRPPTSELQPPIETGTIVPVLSVAETAALLKYEAVIRAGQETFVRVGNALARIRDAKLYRGKYGTFKEYCQIEWDMTDRYARNLWAAAEVFGELEQKGFTVLPAAESQARPLTELPREEVAPAWEEVVGTAPGGKITAKHVETVCDRRMARLKPENRGQKPEARTPIDAGTRGEQIIAAHAAAVAKLRELQDLIPAGDGGAAHVSMALNCIDSFQGHSRAVGRLRDNVERSLGLNPEHAKRVQEFRKADA